MARANRPFRASLFVDLPARNPYRLATLRAALEIRRDSLDSGIPLELLVCADAEDRAIHDLLRERATDDRETEVWLKPCSSEFRSPGVIPQEWIHEAQGEYIALLEAPDLASRNWISSAFAVLESLPASDASRTVVHPEIT